jgi:membrane peptidoglycan carboxypeptidase
VNSFFQTSKDATKKRRPGLVIRTLRALFNLSLILVVTALVLVTGIYMLVVQDYGDRLDRPYPVLEQKSLVFDAAGEEVGEFAGAVDRQTVGPRGLGENLPKAVIAVEDRRFHEHFGVDLEGLARAAWIDLRAWDIREGGSTITEQLMKNLYIPEEEWLEVSFWRRFTQSSLAFAYERRHTKEEILTTYLNTVYFGNGAYGAQVAAERYFGKDARELNLSEAAALAGFLRAPSTYFAEDRAEVRRDEVLGLMREQGLISREEYQRATEASLEFAPAPPPPDPALEPYLEKVRREVEDRLGAEALARGGLRIQTTLEPEMQRAAVEVSEETLPLEDDPAAAVVTVEPQSGAILALAGQVNDFNLALDARRQPGSSFKPFVLAAALEEGISPQSVYLSETLALDDDYVIANYDQIERGGISLYEAMAESDNTAFVRLAMDVGLKRVARTARELGVTTKVDPHPSTAIGGLDDGVSPLDMASAYATFAGGGIHREPYAVERVDRVEFGESESVYDHTLRGRRVMSGNEAATVTEVLRGVVENGTASRYHDLDAEIGHPSAGKTGTTDEYADAWYVGYTPRLSTAVWVGYPDGRRPMLDVAGLEEVGGETLPLDLWSDYMARAAEEDPVLSFPAPDLGSYTYVDRSYAGY